MDLLSMSAEDYKLFHYVEKLRKRIRDKNPGVKTAHQAKGHFYVSPKDPEPYHSVTFYTSFIKDPSLANWKMNRALGHVREWYEVINQGNMSEWEESMEAFDLMIEKAKLAPEGEFLNAGDIGTQTHNWRQKYFQAWIDSGEGKLSDAEIDAWPLPQNVDPEVISGCRAIKRFLKETGYIPIACELALVDDQLKVGGTIDDLGVMMVEEVEYGDSHDEEGNIIPGVKTIVKRTRKPRVVFVDLKTSNQGKKPAYAYQVRGFYQRMIWKTYRMRPKKTYILHTSKEDGTYKLIDLTDMKFLEREVKFLVYASRAWDKVVEGFKPKVITI